MSKLRNFYNKISKNNRIISREDIGEMSPKEFEEMGNAISYQIGEIGAPPNVALAEEADDVVFVHAYIKEDGTKVKAHYRSKAGQCSIEPQNTTIQNDSNITLQGYVSKNDVADNETQKQAPINISPSTIEDLVIKGLLSTKCPPAVQWGMDTFIKFGADIGMYPQASKFWDLASSGIDKNTEYINNNGSVFRDIESANVSLEKKLHIKQKIKSQFGIDNCSGIVFHENSSIAKAVEKSETLKKFVDKNKDILKSGRTIKNSSMSFSSAADKDLYYAFGKVDVLNAKIKNGKLDMTIIDTYDFNKNDARQIVKAGRFLQDTKRLTPYYTVVKIRVPYRL